MNKHYSRANSAVVLVTRRSSALTRTDWAACLGVIFVVAIILLAGLSRGKVRADWGSCWGNLRLTALGFRMWAEDNKDKFPMEVPGAEGGTSQYTNTGDTFNHFLVLSNYVITPRAAWCPKDEGRRRPHRFDASFSDSNVSYFVNTDATRKQQERSILAGDRKIAISGFQVDTGLLRLHSNNIQFGWTKDIHNGRGNVAFADGRVEQWVSPQMQAVFGDALGTNRLLIP